MLLPIKKIITKNQPNLVAPNDFGKVRPLQEAVLGALMLDRNAVDVVVEVLKSPRYFYGDDHQFIFSAILDLHRRYQPIDLLMVTERLKKRNQLKKAGGPFYLVGLTNRVASAANIEYHSRIIAQYFLKRLVWELGQNANKAASHPQADGIELFGFLCDELANLEKELFGKKASSMADLAYISLKNIERAKEQQNGITGIPTGFVELDRLTAGLQNSDLVVLAARPGMGKTALVLKTAKNVAKLFGISVGLFMLEMSDVQGFNRMVSMESEIPAAQLKTGQLDDLEWQLVGQTMEQLAQLPIHIDDTPSINLLQLRAKAKKMVVLEGVQMIIIDYLQLLEGMPNVKYGNAEQRVSAISRALKGLAKELNVPIIALSQLSRSCENRPNKRPKLADLRQSGAIEQDADIVGFLYRDEYYQITEDEQGNSTLGKAELIIAKHRNGALGTIPLKFNASTTDFYDFQYNEWDQAPFPTQMPNSILLKAEPSTDDFY